MNAAVDRLAHDKLLRAETFSVLRNSPSMPSPTLVARDVIRLTKSESASIGQIEHSIRADPVFVSQVLTVVNFGRVGERAIISIKDALQVLGMSSIRGIALGCSLLSSYRSGPCAQFDYRKFWQLALANAVSLQAVSEWAKMANGDEMFTLGLLSDLGQLMLASVFPERYGTVLTSVEITGAPLHEEEIKEFGVANHELAAELLLECGLPLSMAEGLTHLSKELPIGSERKISFISNALSFSKAMARLLVTSQSLSLEHLQSFYLAAARLGIHEAGANELARLVEDRWRDCAKNLGFSISQKHGAMSCVEAIKHLQANLPDVKNGNPLRVLVIDDDAAPRAFLVRVLEDCGHEVYSAEDGESGLRLALELTPDVLITDWVMPGISGLDMLRRLRTHLVGQRVYTLVITARTSDEDLVEAFDAGADDFIPKPLQEKTLLARLKAGQRIVQLQKDAEIQFEEMRSITAELSDSNRRLQKMAITDSLTQCPNRRYAIEFGEQAWATANLMQSPLSCMLIDVDWFKQINDIYGHERGDQTLILIAGAINKNLGPKDVICRFGGDEFLVICPGADLTLALRMGEVFCKAVTSLGIKISDKPCGVSIGVAQKKGDMTTFGALLDAADHALYRAKRNGRCRVEVYAGDKND